MENKVTVNIYGQEYVIIGDKSEEEIQRIAEYVNNKMHLISRISANGTLGSIGILSAINIAEEYFETLAQMEALRTSKIQVENDCKYYLKMWEDAKSNFDQYKGNLSDMKSQRQEYENHIRELEARCTEYENSFFDLQMENIQLKSELEKLKKDK